MISDSSYKGEYILEKKKSIYWRVLLILLCLTVLMGLMGLSPALCDWYTDHIYGILCDGISRITGLFPVAIGELIMYLGVLMVLLGILFLILLPFLRKREKYRRFCACYYKTFLMMLMSIVFIYMPTWFVPFRGTVLGQGEKDARTEFTYDEIYALTAYAADGANAAAEEIVINQDGTVDFPTEEESRPLIADAMRSLADEFPRLSGYYPPVKTALCSDILSRMGIGGYNYPYTMEPTHSKYTSPTYQPILDAHELAHHKGYYKENEANLLSQLALTQSEDPFLRLSGFMNMYFYLEVHYLTAYDNALNMLMESGQIAWKEDLTDEERMKLIQQVESLLGKQLMLSERVHNISAASSTIKQEIYEEDEHPIDEMPPVVDEVISDTADVGWETQEAILQENTYSGVTLLLLQYFDGTLY